MARRPHDALTSLLRGKTLPTLEHPTLRPDPYPVARVVFVANRDEGCPLNRLRVPVSVSNVAWMQRGEFAQ
jgi:hypothetical protein